MKLTELFINQKVTIQILWGEQVIEFFSNVIENDGTNVYVTPYQHNDSPLEINITADKNISCNIYTNHPANKQRISWKNVELTTVLRNDKTVYCIRTNGFNSIAKHDDRRGDNRIIVQVKAKAFEGNQGDGTDIVIHDISDVGISFYAPKSFEPKAAQIVVTFTDTIDEKVFIVKVTCTIARMTQKAGNNFIGCKIVGENKDYKLYGFMKRLKSKK